MKAICEAYRQEICCSSFTTEKFVWYFAGPFYLSPLKIVKKLKFLKLIFNGGLILLQNSNLVREMRSVYKTGEYTKCIFLVEEVTVYNNAEKSTLKYSKPYIR